MAVQEMFEEGHLLPTIENAASRSGLSLRSVYRYFADPEELIEAVIERYIETAVPIARIPDFGRGDFAQRVVGFSKARMRLYEHASATYRATVHHARRSEPVRQALLTTRKQLGDQFTGHFAHDIAALPRDRRAHLVAAGDALTQFSAIQHLREFRGLSIAKSEKALEHGIRALLEPTTEHNDQECR
jgi:AcrR family transcriptional regulator